MFNFETVVNSAMEQLTEDKILIMFPESRHYENSKNPEQDLIEEMPVDLIESMLKDADPELLVPSIESQISHTTEAKNTSVMKTIEIEKDLTEVFDVQLDSLAEALERLRYYLHEIEQFLPEKSRHKR